MATSWHTHQTPEESQVRQVEEKHKNEKCREHKLRGVLEVVIWCLDWKLSFDCVEAASRSSEVSCIRRSWIQHIVMSKYTLCLCILHYGLDSVYIVWALPLVAYIKGFVWYKHITSLNPNSVFSFLSFLKFFVPTHVTRT